ARRALRAAPAPRRRRPASLRRTLDLDAALPRQAQRDLARLRRDHRLPPPAWLRAARPARRRSLPAAGGRPLPRESGGLGAGVRRGFRGGGASGAARAPARVERAAGASARAASQATRRAG